MKKLYDLSNAQNSIWLIEQYYKNSCINNLCLTTQINETIDFVKLSKAINIFVEKNDAARIKLIIENDKIKQYFTEYKPFNIETLNTSNKTELNNLEEILVKTPFNLLNSILFNFKLFKFPNNTGGFIVNAHHIIADGFSGRLVADSILNIYNDLLTETAISTTSNNSYVNVLTNENDYLNSSRFEKDKDFWNTTYKQETEIAHIYSTTNASNSITKAERKLYCLDKDFMEKINDFCKTHKTSIFNFIISIISIYIGRVSSLKDVVLGTPVLNRNSFLEKNTFGMFINVIPVKFSLENIEFSSFLKGNASSFMQFFKHSRYPYHYILNNISATSLYDILVSYQNTKINNSTNNISTNWTFNRNTSNSLEIHISDLNNSGMLNFMYDYRTEKYQEKEIDNIHKRICYLINQVIKEPQIFLNDLEIVTPEEKSNILKINNTSFTYDKNNSFISYYNEQVQKNPQKTAVVFGNKKLTYKELEEKSNCLANYLLSKNIKENEYIGIMTNRSLEMIIGILAIIKIGCCYIPIDPNYPLKRIEYIIKNSKSRFLLVNGKTNEKSHIDISLNNSAIYKNNVEAPKITIQPEDLIYLIYTSGSTGNPKGVMIKHSNITNFIESMNKYFNFDNKNIVSLTTICFDIFGLELFCSLANGATLIIANEEEQLNTKKFNELCLKNNVNIIQTTPSRISGFLKDTDNLGFLTNISDLLIGGESFPITLLNKLKNISSCNIYNMYGPTETTIWSTIKNLTNESKISIGGPIGNTQCYVLDSQQNLLPPNTPGNLYISGDGVSKGYINSQFNENFVEKNDKILYNTNDLVYLNNSNNIIYLNRIDNQIKIRGYRIDISEIENKLALYEGISEVSVMFKNNLLICFYISSKSIDNSKIIKYLLDFLPNYMIPNYFIKLDKFPLTPNGKTNKKELFNYEIDYGEKTKPTTKTEKILVKVIGKIVGKTITNTNSQIFSLGLDSLGIIEVQTKLIAYNIILNTQDFYKYATIKDLAEQYDKKSAVSNENFIDIPDEFKHSSIKTSNFNINENILGNVFLTGANGFVGIHILRELLETTTNNIYCLVRGTTPEISVSRLTIAYTFYFKEDISKYLNKRVFVINGTINEKNLGLNTHNFELFKNTIDSIIHTAANVKHYGETKLFEDVNINGTENLAEFALENKKLFIHISSISISGNYLLTNSKRNVVFSENNLLIGQQYTDNVYVNSKLAAEKIILNYMKKGLTAKILRLGILSGRYSDGIFQKNIAENAFYNRLKSLIILSKVPDNILSQKIEFTPVDLCSKAIVLLSKNSITNNKVFHLFNHNFYEINNFIKALNAYNINVDITSKEDFNKYIKENPKKLISIINDLTFDTSKAIDLNYNPTVNIKSIYTQKYLKLLGFIWPEIDLNYIKKLIEKGDFL